MNFSDQQQEHQADWSSPAREEPRDEDSASPNMHSDTAPATSLGQHEGQGEPDTPNEALVETTALSSTEQGMPLVEDSTEMLERTGTNEVEVSVFQMDPPTSSDEATTEVSKGGLPNDDPNSEANTSSQPDAVRGYDDEARSLQDGSAPSQLVQTVVINESSDLLEPSRGKDDSAGARHIGPVFHTPTLEASPTKDPERQSTRNVQPQQDTVVDPSLINSARSWDNSSEHFVNRGLALWERSRQGWLHRNSADSTDSSRAVATPLDVVRGIGSARIFPCLQY